MGLEHSHLERSFWVFLFWGCSSVNVLSCVPFHPLCRLTKYTVVCTPLSPTICWQMAFMTLRYCFHQATSTDPLKSGPSTAVVMHLYPLWDLWRQLRLWPHPTLNCMCTQSPQLLKPDPYQLQEHLLSVWMFLRQ